MATLTSYEQVHESIQRRLVMSLIFTRDDTPIEHIRGMSHDVANAALGDVAEAVRGLPTSLATGDAVVRLEDVLLILGQRT